ncbi:MAG: NUDIX domain-containing protein [Anaerolineales bacterium]|nr:NUDIX domain-containing protein [Anaerolineales bacterium]
MSEYTRRLRECIGNDLLISQAAAACIRDSQGRILLLRRSDGENLWGFPGGVIEPDERADEAVVRETFEETGLKVEPVSLIGVYSGPEYRFTYPNGDLAQPLVVFFECRVVGGELRPDLDESMETRYFGPEDVMPPMRACCVAKARDAFAHDGPAFSH